MLNTIQLLQNPGHSFALTNAAVTNMMACRVYRDTKLGIYRESESSLRVPRETMEFRSVNLAPVHVDAELDNGGNYSRIWEALLKNEMTEIAFGVGTLPSENRLSGIDAMSASDYQYP